MLGSGIRSIGISLVALGITLATASSAPAATTIGQTATGTPSCGTFDTLRVQKSLGAAGSYDIPSAGVLTSWSVKANGADSLELKVVDPTNQNSLQYTILASSTAQTTSGTAVQTFPTRIPVTAGSRIALWTLGGGSTCVFDTASVNDAVHSGPDSADPANGTPYSVTLESQNRRVNLSAQLEADADGDSYGDETQDLCPTNPATQGECPDVPETEIDKAPKNKVKTKTRKASVTIKFSSSEPDSTFECSLDGATAEPCTSPFKEKVGLGLHTFSVAATSIGGTDASPAIAAFTVKKKRH